MPALDHHPAQGAESRGDILAGAALLTAAAVYWWPILADPAGRIAGGNGDPLFMAYIVTWVATHLGDPALWNPPFFAPAQEVLAYSDHLLGLGTVVWPLVTAGLPPVAIVNLLSILGSLLTSLALYTWLRDRGHDAAASGATALVLTYSAWRHLQIAHLQLQWMVFLPMALMCFGRAIAGRAGGRWWWAGGAALAVQTLFTPSLGVMMMPLVLVWLVVASVLAGRVALRHWVAVAASVAIAGVVNLPIAAHYWRLGDALDRDVVEIARHSAAWIDWLSSQRHWLYGDALMFTRGGERELFAGFLWLAVAAVGVAVTLRGRDPVARAGLAAAGAAIWASAGLSEEGISAARLPYELFHRFAPGGGQVRVPVRFVLLAAVFLAPAMAAAWTSLRAALARRHPSFAAPVVVLLLAGAVVAEGLADTAWYEPAANLRGLAPPSGTRGSVLYVPLAEAAGPRREIHRMWGARLTGVPIVNGYSGHESPLYRRLRDIQSAPPAPDVQRALYGLLRRYGVSTIVAEAAPSSLLDRSRLEEVAPGVLRIPDTASAVRFDRFEMGRGASLLLTVSGWSYPERNERESWVWTTRPAATLQIPLGAVPRRRISLRARSQSDGDVLELWWNGRRLGVQPLDASPAFHEFQLPEAVNGESWIDLELRGPAPVRMPGNPDPRALSVCLFEIRLE